MRIRGIVPADVRAFPLVFGGFVLLLPGLIAESFLWSLLAVLLSKGLLEMVMLLRKPAHARLKVA